MSDSKFRSWNDNFKKFYYFENGKYYNDVECNNYYSSKANVLFKWNDAEKYISKTDKNKKEIYTGDIINRKTWDGKWIVIRYDSVHSGHATAVTYGYTIPDDIKGDGPLEVIGNIHEDPELWK